MSLVRNRVSKRRRDRNLRESERTQKPFTLQPAFPLCASMISSSGPIWGIDAWCSISRHVVRLMWHGTPALIFWVVNGDCINISVIRGNQNQQPMPNGSTTFSWENSQTLPSKWWVNTCTNDYRFSWNKLILGACITKCIWEERITSPLMKTSLRFQKPGLSTI